MKEKGYATRLFALIFVTYPIGYILLLLAGVLCFLYVSFHTMLPVYETIEATVVNQEEQMVIYMGDIMPVEASPIYLYQVREQYMEKVENYQVDLANGLIVIPNSQFKQQNVINLDIEIGKVSLLEYIFVD